MTITIDGLSGVGKSAVAHGLSRSLHLPFLSVGLVVRAVAWMSLQMDMALENLDISDMRIETGKDGFPEIFVSDQNISDFLYGYKEIEERSPLVGRNESLQKKIYTLIQRYCKDNEVVLEGRNAHSLLPDADMKVFLWANKNERMKRNMKTYADKFQNTGQSEEYTQLALQRDYQDIRRRNDPLRIHEDMVMWDSTNLTLSDTVSGLTALYKHYKGEKLYSASVVIPVKNRAAHLDVCLAHLFNQTLTRERYEVIVVDDGSTDSSMEVARNYGATVINSDSKGVSSSRNTGALAATGEIVIVLDCDMLVQQTFIEEQIRYHTTTNHTVVLGPRRHLKEGIQYIDTSSRLDSREVLLNLHSFELDCLNHPWSVAYTCNVSLPRTLATKHLFDENMTGWGLEDIEWAYRLSQENVRWILARSLTAFHLYHDREMNQERFGQWKKNLSYFTHKHEACEVRSFRLFEDVFDPLKRCDYMEVYARFNDTKKPAKKGVILDLSSSPYPIQHLQDFIFNTYHIEECEIIALDKEERSFFYPLILPILREHVSIRFFFVEDFPRFKQDLIADYLSNHLTIEVHSGMTSK
jgi:cytidylate kinase